MLAAGVDPPLIYVFRSPQSLQYQLDLVLCALSREQNTAQIDLCDDAPEAPNIHGLVVLVAIEQDFRGSVPPSRNVIRDHRAMVEPVEVLVLRFFLGLLLPSTNFVVGASQPEVRNLEGAVVVDQHVAGLQIAVDEAGGVHVSDALGDLVHDELLLQLVEVDLVDDVVQVGLHQIENQVEILGVLALEDALQSDDVGVLEL